MIVDGVRSLSGAVGGRKTKISHTPSREIYQIALVLGVAGVAVIALKNTEWKADKRKCYVLYDSSL